MESVAGSSWNGWPDGHGIGGRIGAEYSAFALLTLPITAHTQETKLEQLGSGETYIAVDEESGLVVFVVQGQKQAVLDENGLHVRGSIHYGEMMRDTGAVGFDELYEESAEVSGDE